MPLAAGTRVGAYEITSKIGEGGMGEVYLARDARLERDVAIKILPEAFAADADRVARFEREARTLASLNHAGIGAIYGLEEVGGSRALILEYIDGPTLADRIAQGPIPIDDALAIARQIAEALEAAHEQQIVHRDLKPSNIKVRPDGMVKVLDFGLAKALHAEASSTNLSLSPTLSLTAATRIGTVVGTAAYMSPEQAKGRQVDRRADVWAFGVVLFEMLTGKPPFIGEDVSDTLVAILRDEPPWDALPADVPANVRQALRVCLQKDPKHRVRDVSAIRLAFDGMFDTPADSRPAQAAAKPPRRLLRLALWIAGTFALGVIATSAAAVWMRPVPSPRVTRFILTTPADAPPQVSQSSSVAISPDGSRIAYRTSRGEPPGPTNGMLYLREIDQIDPTPIRGTESSGGFFFSRDGEWIVFANNSDNTLRRVSIRGGPAQTICTLDGGFRGGSWGSDGSIVFATSARKGIQRVPSAGGEPVELTTVDQSQQEANHWWPEVLPDGKSVLFVAWGGSPERSRIVVRDASGKLTDVVQGGSAPRFLPAGYFVYAIDDTLRAVRFDPARLKVTGDPFPVAQGVGVSFVGGASYSVSADGSLVYVSGANLGVNQRTLTWVDRKGQQDDIKVPPRPYTYARLSPDNTRVALDSRDQQNDIWVFEFARGSLQRLTTDPGLNRSPVWTPNGKRIAFTAQRDNNPESVYWQNADGSGTPERLSVTPTIQGPSGFSQDGKFLVMNVPLTPPYDIGLLSLEGDRKEQMLIKTNFNESNGELSPDGHWLAYQSNESGRDEVYVVPFPDVNASKQNVSPEGGTRPLWSSDGRELFYYVEPGTIVSVPVTTGATLGLGKPTVVVKGPYAVAVNSGRHYDVSKDGRRFLLLKDVATTPTGAAPQTQMHFVQHWDEELKRLVRAK